MNEVKTERSIRRHSVEQLPDRVPNHNARDLPPPPKSRRRRRWPWMVALLFGILGIAGAARRHRSLAQRKIEWLGTRAAEQPTSQYREPVATGGSPTGNGVVRAERPSAGTD